MEEWKEYKLGDLYDVHNGLSKGGKFFGSGYPFLSFKTVFNNYLLPPVLPDLVQSDEKEQGGYDIKRGDVFVTRTSETPEELGMSSVALKDYPFATYNGFTKRLRPKNTSIIYPEFIGYYLRSTKFRALFYGLASSMSTRASLANGDLLGMKVFLPAFATQEKVAKILKSFDDKIEVNRQINDNLEQQAQALFKSWFVDFEPFKDQPLVESELGMFPQGWRVGTLGEIIKEIESGSRPKGGAETNGIPSIGAEKIERFGVYDYSGEKYINNDFYINMKRGHVENGDVLLYKDGAYTGKSSMALDGFPYCECAVNEHVFLLRTESSKSQFFLYYLISYPEIKTMIHTLASSKAAQPGLNQKELLGLDIIIPDEDTVKLFNNQVSPSMHQIATNSKQSRRLAELRDTLLPRLMSGEIKINDINS